MIPGYNDSLDEIKDFCNWVCKELGTNIPIHFSRFHPDYNLLDVKATSIKTMVNVYNIAKKQGIKHAYLGNVNSEEHENTYCPNCGNICIERSGYSIDQSGIKNGKCLKCNADINVIFQNYKT